MPKRSDIHKILIIGSGPIQIGQGCEFDYSGTQACKALKDEGYEIVLINSNPATIMTDPDSADKVYIEPISYDFIIKVIEAEGPDAILPTMGGQAGLNMLMELHEKGDLEKYHIESIGVKPETISLAEDREQFKKLVDKLGYATPRGGFVHSAKEAENLLIQMNLEYPVIIRASFTLGGTGGGIAYDAEEFKRLVERGLKASPTSELLIEECIFGWKEYELEVMQDKAMNFVVVCGVENVNPVGVHTGDSITVAPCMTLTDKEYQQLRDIAKHIFHAIGMESGGANIQFAVHPENGRIVVIEMNPRVSRSSALVSKATGYPIARISAKIAVGYSMDELKNEITGFTPAAFEPVIDYVAIKIPRWDFTKFPDSFSQLGVQMKSVGEVLAFGRSFKDAFQKAWRSLELGYDGWPEADYNEDEFQRVFSKPTDKLFMQIKTAFKRGHRIDEIHQASTVSYWFLHQLKELYELELELQEHSLDESLLRKAKKHGFSDSQLAKLSCKTEAEIRQLRLDWHIKPSFKMVDTCAAEYSAKTPYYFKTYEMHNDNRISDRKKIIIIGSGPNRIGQGIEFDYSCVHAVKSFQNEGYESILINCNPETVSTDYNTSDKLYVEPLTEEDLLDILDAEKPFGVVIQFGGQTPLKLANAIEKAGYRILGTDYASIELAENRDEFGNVLKKLNLRAPEFGTAMNVENALKIAAIIKYPVLVRPSYVLGGRGMKIVYNDTDLIKYIRQATEISPNHPVLIDKYLENAVEFDVDAISDGELTFIGGIMQHIEEAGIHSGDSSCVLPPFWLAADIRSEMIRWTKELCNELKIIGLVNIQFAVYDKKLYILEVNPRSSRTVPFVSKATGIPLAKKAAKLAVGYKLHELVLSDDFNMDKENNLIVNEHRDNIPISVKIPVFPFAKFDNVNPYLGPEMRSIGEVMGRSNRLGQAYAKALIAAGFKLPISGGILVTVNNKDKFNMIPIVRDIYEIGFDIYATTGTAKFLRDNGIAAKSVRKYSEAGEIDSTVDIIEKGLVQWILNTPLGEQAREDEYVIGQAAIKHNVSFTASLSTAYAFTRAVRAMKENKFTVSPL